MLVILAKNAGLFTFSMPTQLSNSMVYLKIQAAGIHTVVTVIGSSLIGVFGFILVLIFGAQVGGNSSLYGSLSSSNVSAITGNIGKGVVSGSGFVPLIFLGSAGAVTLGIFLLVFEVVSHFKGSA